MKIQLNTASKNLNHKVVFKLQTIQMLFLNLKGIAKWLNKHLQSLYMLTFKYKIYHKDLTFILLYNVQNLIKFVHVYLIN